MSHQTLIFAQRMRFGYLISSCSCGSASCPPRPCHPSLKTFSSVESVAETQRRKKTTWSSSSSRRAPAARHHWTAHWAEVSCWATDERNNCHLSCWISNPVGHCLRCVSSRIWPRGWGNERGTRSKSESGGRDDGDCPSALDGQGAIRTRSASCHRYPEWSPWTTRRHFGSLCSHHSSYHARRHACPRRSASYDAPRRATEKSSIPKRTTRRRRIVNVYLSPSSCPSYAHFHRPSYDDNDYPRNEKCTMMTMCTTLKRTTRSCYYCWSCFQNCSCQRSSTK
mmetsp:Transcript_40565/g.86386  ORF Transcript_40565/g.86386 Transcript_40565/m.86386 type:complete len:281 (-) Transcript_40565:2473-3315(-)